MVFTKTNKSLVTKLQDETKNGFAVVSFQVNMAFRGRLLMELVPVSSDPDPREAGHVLGISGAWVPAEAHWWPNAHLTPHRAPRWTPSCETKLLS